MAKTKQQKVAEQTKEKLGDIHEEEKKQTRLETATQKEMRELKAQLKKIIRVHKYSLIEHPARLLSFQFMIGLARGVGSFIGATLVIGALIFILSALGFTDILQSFEDLRRI
ncbi:hypothetical protein HQ524_04845 [Candidatus Uhrbacteria bacterium]|nr:hypothetical protein [Candidatus Uhrbacteria bacterium]